MKSLKKILILCLCLTILLSCSGCEVVENVFSEMLSKINPIYTITFANYEDEVFVPISINAGSTIYKPTPNTTKDGYEFNWYTEPEFINIFIFYKMPNCNLTLYGRWDEIDKSSFLDTTPSNTVKNFSELVNYFNYVVFNYIPTTTVMFNYSAHDYLAEVNRAIEQTVFGYGLKWQNSMLIGGNSVNVKISFSRQPTKTTNQQKVAQYLSCYCDIESSRSADFDNFAINNAELAYNVSTTDQLFFILQKGYLPIFAEDNIAKQTYERAKEILRECVDDNMNDFEKVHAIYDWLVYNVTYDQALANIGNSDDWMEYRGHYVEGALIDGFAVCSGIAKAMTVLCNIEGIHTEYITGQNIIEGKPGHAWNNVYIDGKWYLVDATFGQPTNNGFESMTHKYLFGDISTHIEKYRDFSIVHPVCTDYNFYTTVTQFDAVIDNKIELNNAVRYYCNTLDETTETKVINFDASNYKGDFVKDLSYAFGYYVPQEYKGMNFMLDNNDMANVVAYIKIVS